MACRIKNCMIIHPPNGEIVVHVTADTIIENCVITCVPEPGIEVKK